MHYTGTLYRNPYELSSPLLEITQGCTHNKCKFCSMYKTIPFKLSPLEWIEEDLKEIADYDASATRLQIVGADPFCMSFEQLNKICDLIHKYLPQMITITMNARITNIKNKSIEELKILKEKGIKEIYIGIESGDDWTLKRINKGYSSFDIIEQCSKLDAAGINYWMTFLNGVAGKSHSHEHAINSARIFSQCNPIVVGTGGLVLFEETELQQEEKIGKFDQLNEKELMMELKTFVENLNCKPKKFITHHTSSINLTGPFVSRKQQIIESLQHGIDNCNINLLGKIRQNKTNL